MNTKIRRLGVRSIPFLSGMLAILLAAAIVASPESSFAASLQGLKLWWSLVFPALLPFLMLSEMLTASGFVHGIGVLLEPLMTRVFRLPGAGGWTLALGATAGFPGGAGGVLQLHKQGSLTGKEAGRLASLVHFASPVTLLIVIGAALLHNPAAGYSLLVLHWLAGLLAGFTAARLGWQPSKPPAPATVSHSKRDSLYHRVTNAAAHARAQDGRSFGKLLGEAVGNAVQNLMVVGGYIIMFAVIINILVRLFPGLPAALPASLLELHLGTQALTGINETAGANAASSPNGTAGILGFALLSAALGWSGICAQLQVLTLLKSAGIRLLPFAAVRLLHGSYAFVLTLLLWKPLMSLQEKSLPTFTGTQILPAGDVQTYTLWSAFPQLLGVQIALLALLMLLSGAVYLFTTLRRRSG
ncbi:nucleoside recognition protein [Paenibacillus agri]|uniref:Nucleoside recognition protein n=1 Tax=Paenibacillus agri TaxID=2744309 RepID=A0A850EYB3_9BACL|nr:nucleoside recognition protein [Paenibacillus agri]NUU64477.1 nucleoside recognition protein [Paenibacillus agri]